MRQIGYLVGILVFVALLVTVLPTWLIGGGISDEPRSMMASAS